MSERATTTRMALDSRLLYAVAHDAAVASERSSHHAIACVVLSAAAVEGFVNEIAEWSRINTSGRPSDIAAKVSVALHQAESQNASTLDKVQAAILAGTAHPVERGRQPYQDLALLLQVRNAVLHLKTVAHVAEPDGANDPPEHKILRRLRHRLKIGAGSQPISWLDGLQHPLVAAWSYNTARAGAELLLTAFAGSNFHLMLMVTLRDYPPTIGTHSLG